MTHVIHVWCNIGQHRINWRPNTKHFRYLLYVIIKCNYVVTIDTLLYNYCTLEQTVYTIELLEIFCETLLCTPKFCSWSLADHRCVRSARLKKHNCVGVQSYISQNISISPIVIPKRAVLIFGAKWGTLFCDFLIGNTFKN